MIRFCVINIASAFMTFISMSLECYDYVVTVRDFTTKFSDVITGTLVKRWLVVGQC